MKQGKIHLWAKWPGRQVSICGYIGSKNTTGDKNLVTCKNCLRMFAYKTTEQGGPKTIEYQADIILVSNRTGLVPKIHIIKAVRQITSVGLKEAKAFVDTVDELGPKMLLANLDYGTADLNANILTRAGALVQLCNHTSDKPSVGSFASNSNQVAIYKGKLDRLLLIEQAYKEMFALFIPDEETWGVFNQLRPKNGFMGRHWPIPLGQAPTMEDIERWKEAAER